MPSSHFAKTGLVMMLLGGLVTFGIFTSGAWQTDGMLGKIALGSALLALIGFLVMVKGVKTHLRARGWIS